MQAGLRACIRPSVVIVPLIPLEAVAPDPSPMKVQSGQVKVGDILGQVPQVCTSCDLTEVFCQPLA